MNNTHKDIYSRTFYIEGDTYTVTNVEEGVATLDCGRVGQYQTRYFNVEDLFSLAFS